MHKYLFTKHTKAMKKLTYLAVAAVALGVASCNTNKPGYVITGTVEALPTEILYLSRNV